MTITLELSAEMEQQLEIEARMHGKDVPAFLLESVRQRMRRDVLSESEATLLQAINAPIAPEARQQRNEFIELQKQRALTESERETLAKLIDTVELANAARWERIAELAQRRGVSLAEIAQTLEIPLS